MNAQDRPEDHPDLEESKCCVERTIGQRNKAEDVDGEGHPSLELNRSLLVLSIAQTMVLLSGWYCGFLWFGTIVTLSGLVAIWFIIGIVSCCRHGSLKMCLYRMVVIQGHTQAAPTSVVGSDKSHTLSVTNQPASHASVKDVSMLSSTTLLWSVYFFGALTVAGTALFYEIFWYRYSPTTSFYYKCSSLLDFPLPKTTIESLPGKYSNLTIRNPNFSYVKPEFRENPKLDFYKGDPHLLLLPSAGVVICPLMRVLLGCFIIVMFVVALGVTWKVPNEAETLVDRRRKELEEFSHQYIPNYNVKEPDPTNPCKYIFAVFGVAFVVLVASTLQCIEMHNHDSHNNIISGFLLPQKWILLDDQVSFGVLPVPWFAPCAWITVISMIIAASVVTVPTHFILVCGFRRVVGHCKHRMQHLSMLLRPSEDKELSKLLRDSLNRRILDGARSYTTDWLCTRNFIIKNYAAINLQIVSPLFIFLVFLTILMTVMVVSYGFSKGGMPTAALVAVNCLTAWLYLVLFIMLKELLDYYECTMVQKRLLLIHKSLAATRTGPYSYLKREKTDDIKRYLEHLDRIYDFIEKNDGAAEIMGFPIRPSFMTALQGSLGAFLLACISSVVKTK